MNDPVATWRWLATPQGREAMERAAGPTTAAGTASLRKLYSPDQVRIAAEAAAARRKSMGKLDPVFAAGLIADIAGVEMASSAAASAHKAARFRDVLGEGAVVADLCCGIGGDAQGLLAAGMETIGVDCDPARAWMFGHNTGTRTVCGDALNDCPGESAAFHLDPARRSRTGQRTLSNEDFEPGPEVWDAIIERIGHGAIKLNPGVDGYSLPTGELEILSEPAGLTQAVLWVGKLAREHERRATRLGSDGVVTSLVGEPHRPEDSNEIGDYLGTLDPCLERADLVGSFLDLTGTRLVHPGTGLITAELPVEHAMARWYRVAEVLPWSRKRVKAVLRGLNGGIVEVRTRASAVNPDDEQRALRGKGERNDLAVLIYRIGPRIVAVVAEQVMQEEEIEEPRALGVAHGADGIAEGGGDV